MSKYWAVFILSFTQALKNYKAFVGLSIFLITCLVIFAHLWKVVAAKTGVLLSAENLLWYIACNEWILVSLPDVQDDMEQDLRSGRLAYLLPRPISYLGATAAEAVGTFFANFIVLGVVTFLFTWLQVGSIPFSLTGLFMIIFFGFAAGCVALLFQMLIGISAFWFQEVTPFFWIWEKLLFMLGGLMLPLTVYPQWLQFLAQCTPFPAILGLRSALVFDCSFHTIATLASSLLGWGICGCMCLYLLYRRGLNIVNVEGG